MQDDIGCFKIINTYRQTFLLTALTYKSLLKFLLFLYLIMSKTGLLRVQFSAFSYSSLFCLFEYASIVNVVETTIASRVLTFVKDMPTKKTKQKENSQLNHVLVDLK